MYPYFKLLIFGYISRFLTKFSTLLTFLYVLNTNQPLVLVLDLGNMVKKWFTKRYLIIGKNPPFGFYPSMGYLLVSKSKNSFGFEFPCLKTSQYNKSAKFENSFKIGFFNSLVLRWCKKIQFSKSFPIWLICCTGRFLGM